MTTLPAGALEPLRPPPARSVLRARLGALLAGLAAFVALFRIGIPAAGDALDGSWTAVLSWAFSQGAQFGDDIVFTYGPLGFLIPIANYHPQTYALFFAAQVFFGVVWAALIARFAVRLPMPAQALLCLLLLGWATMIMVDVGWYLMFALAAVFAAEDAKRGWRGLLFGIPVLLALTLIALTKFTFLLLWCAFTAHLLLQLLLARRPAAAATVGTGAAALFLGLWTAAGQKPSTLPLFFLRGFDVSRGYNASMGYVPRPEIDAAGLALLGLSIFCLAPVVTGKRQSPSRRALGVFLLLLLALTWKAGYIRADSHVCIFFGSASLLTFVGVALWPSERPRTSGHAAAAVVSAAGLAAMLLLFGGVTKTLDNTWQYIAYSLRHLAAPQEARKTFQASWDAGAQQFDLPLSRQRIRNGEIDLLMHEQGVVLLNGFNYAPRPAFQGYAAGSVLLARLNEARLLGARAPRFLLFKLQAIDAHFPGNEDPLAQLAALRAYRPVLYEKGYVLLERQADAASIRPPSTADWREAGFGEAISVPAGSPQIVFYRVELSLLGKLYSAVFREPKISLRIEDPAGGVYGYDLARSLGDAGTLVSPLLLDNAAYLSWYTGLRDQRARTLRFVHAPAAAGLFVSRLSYALQPVALPRQDPARLPESLRLGTYPGFSHLPRREHSPTGAETVTNLGETMHFMHAPASLEFVLPRGRWQVEGRFGLSAAVYAPGVCPQSDGARLQVYHGTRAPTAPSALLFSRRIDPLHVEADRGNLTFSIPSFDSDGTTPVTFEFSGGENSAATTDCDWTLIGPLHFMDLSAGAP